MSHNLDLSRSSQQPIPRQYWPGPATYLPLHLQYDVDIFCQPANNLHWVWCWSLFWQESCNVRSGWEEGGPWNPGPGAMMGPGVSVWHHLATGLHPGGGGWWRWWSRLVQRQVMLRVSPLCCQSSVALGHYKCRQCSKRALSYNQVGHHFYTIKTINIQYSLTNPVQLCYYEINGAYSRENN